MDLQNTSLNSIPKVDFEGSDRCVPCKAGFYNSVAGKSCSVAGKSRSVEDESTKGHAALTEVVSGALLEQWPTPLDWLAARCGLLFSYRFPGVCDGRFMSFHFACRTAVSFGFGQWRPMRNGRIVWPKGQPFWGAFASWPENCYWPWILGELRSYRWGKTKEPMSRKNQMGG